MSAAFFYGALRDPGLRDIVLGPGARGARMQPAVLPDHAVTWADGDALITAQAGAEAEGVLAEGLDPQAVLRLEFYAGGCGHSFSQDVQVSAAGAPHGARIWCAPAERNAQGTPFDLAAWQAGHGALARIAATEAMEYFGTCSAQVLAARMPMIRARAASRLAATAVPAALRSDTGADAVEAVRTEILHAGFYRVEARELRHPTFGGGMSDTLRREIFIATDAALVLPYDPARDRVLLVEQFRIGPYGRGDPRPWMLEPVAGRVDLGETPEEAAHRECAEEAGLTLARLEKIGGYYCTPGYSTEYFHNFVGIAELPNDLPRYGGLDSEAEDIRLHVLDFAAAMDLIDTGEADDGPLILSLLWLARHRERLRAAA
ncbi:tellurium resistance protein [Pelagivirga sediminicola]|uniref:ADP-ribose pyrophosphatase n=1 Tax=Pelagivirga sediminicola TaxID=2170575 RepID=A0A2T7G9B4_9RHOB|nr:NUDIX domain-containing protein [Pelagivirga sediminicola]PVA11003.1 tellurium resistance protein [Pelagivirga sediminicola]